MAHVAAAQVGRIDQVVGHAGIGGQAHQFLGKQPVLADDGRGIGRQVDGIAADRVRGRPYRRRGADAAAGIGLHEGTAPDLAGDQAAPRRFRITTADRSDGDAQMPGKIAVGGQAGARPQCAAGDVAGQGIGERPRARWPHATVTTDPAAAADMARRIFAAGKEDGPITVHLRGSNFQLRIWEALLRIPPAHVTSYEDIARRTGNARAVRAAASAIARNPVTFVVPCHRVIRKTGPFHNYAGGPLRKQAILGWEQARFGEGRDEVASAA
ncbi:MAG: methylated-DNA--[protein]-cysteine S-methyltransferase [Proteobacteria bacterium]|nr:methylated-DNA--[protein]-cysteine S-methyltransferase [Pseudomonadota bacterium]